MLAEIVMASRYPLQSEVLKRLLLLR